MSHFIGLILGLNGFSRPNKKNSKFLQIFVKFISALQLGAWLRRFIVDTSHFRLLCTSSPALSTAHFLYFEVLFVNYLQ